MLHSVARYLQKLVQKGEAEAASHGAAAAAERARKSSLASALGMKSLGNGISVSPGGGMGLGPGGAPPSSGADSGVAGFGLSVPRAKALTKEEKEKARIKEQYAHFLAKKKEAPAAEPSASGVVSDLIGQTREAMAVAVPSDAAAGGGGGDGPPSSLTAMSAFAASGKGGNGRDTGPDQAKAAELEGLNNDIRSLLSSIQGKSLGEKLALTAPAAARK